MPFLMESFPVRPPPEAPMESPVVVTPRRRPVLPPRQRAHLWILGGLTLLGFVLRFSMLDRPTVWSDETTVWATSGGTYRHAVESAGHLLSPLHTQLEW